MAETIYTHDITKSSSENPFMPLTDSSVPHKCTDFKCEGNIAYEKLEMWDDLLIKVYSVCSHCCFINKECSTDCTTYKLIQKGKDIRRRENKE